MKPRSMPIPLRVLSYAMPYKKRLALAIGALIGLTTFQLLGPSLVAYAIDTGLDVDKNLVPHGNIRTILIAAGLITAAAAARGIFQFWQTYTGEWVSQRVAYDIRNDIYNHLQRLSFAYHDKAQTGQVMQRATQDVEGIRMFVNMGFIRLIYVVILLVSTLALMVWVDWKLALLSWAFIPPTALIAIIMTTKLRPIWLQVQNLQGELGVVLQENLSGMRVVKAFGREKYEEDKFNKQAQLLFDNSYATNRIQATYSPLLNGVWSLAMVATAWFGAYQIIHGNLRAGQLAQFLLLLTMLQLPVRSIGWVNMLWARAATSGQRIYDILDAESAVQEKAGAVELQRGVGHVRFEDVSFGYDLISPVLRHVDIDAKPGEVVALLGQTGSGKSTVVNLMPRFYDVTGGKITIDETDIRDVTLASLRRAFGIVQQDVFLFSATIRDNIAYGASNATDEDVFRVARLARIHEFIETLPDGYDTWVGERGITLSGGQKQRISIARTLLLDPKILVFDDSTSSVDTETEYLIQQALAELMKGRTTFVIAQRLRTVKSADQILVLKNGVIAQHGRHDELIAEDGPYREIYDLELRDQEEAYEREKERLEQVALTPAERETVGTPGGGGAS
ncbi:MAG: ABC transporter ATP-binding protein/permease [Chloroflexota bacterium]|nr:ABC transporter ATP-binding protein/permease [Chloroflexota bacterium]